MRSTTYSRDSSPRYVSLTLCSIFIFLSVPFAPPFKPSRFNMAFILSLTILFLQFLLARGTSQCYMLNGDLATNDFQPCNGNLASGSNSPCCNLGKNPPDICLGGGLCQRMDSVEGNFLIYAVGCTDRTGKDAACPQYCPSEFLLSPSAGCFPQRRG